MHNTGTLPNGDGVYVVTIRPTPEQILYQVQTGITQ